MNSDTTSPPVTHSSAPQLQPLTNPKYRHVSKSAAKRESVQLLGSIKDLQLHFSRGSLEHRSGAGAGVKGSNLGLPSLGEDGKGLENRPPGIGVENARVRERKPWKEVELPKIDPEDARKEARQIVGTVRELWGLSAAPITPLSAMSTSASISLPSSRSLYFSFSTKDDEEEERSSEDIRSALVTTAQSIRRIRFLALSSHQAQGKRVSSATRLGVGLSSISKPRSSFSTPSRPSGMPRAVSQGGHASTERKSSLGLRIQDGGNDVLADLRRAALEILASLRALEERLRLELSQAESVDFQKRSSTPATLQSESRPPSRAFSPLGEASSASEFGTSSTIFTEPEGEAEYAHYSDEDDYNLNTLALSAQEDQRHLQTWEDRLVSEQREYRLLSDSEWEKEARGTRESVGKWVGVVERLFVVTPDKEMTRLEPWAEDDQWEGRELERLHAMLLAYLPIELALHIPPTHAADFNSIMLSRISDGFLVIQAYNAALLSSSKPWGFIPDDNVHDTLSPSTSEVGVSNSTYISEEGRKSDREWTFRRVGNLTSWAAGLRHRYQIPISMPSSTTSSSPSSFLPLPNRTVSPAPGSSSTSSNRTLSSKDLPPITTQFGSSSARREKDVPKIEFDPMVVAKRSEGWEGMLLGLVKRWVGEVAKEVREAHERVERACQSHAES